MGKFDGILKAITGGDNDEDYDDYDDYDDVEYSEPAVKNSKSKKSNDDDEFYDEPKKPTRNILSPKNSNKNFLKKGSTTTINNNMEVSIFYPKSMDAATEIVDALLSDKSVIMNLEGIEMDLAQRIFDFITGSTYAIDGRMEPISKFVYVITPASVSISGDTTTDDATANIGKGFNI